MSANTVSVEPNITSQTGRLDRLRNINWRRWALVPGFAGAIASAACGGNSSPNGASTSAAASVSSGSASSSETTGANVTVTFDSRGSDLSKGGSNVINVYPEATDTTPNGTFMSGQTAQADCKEIGRNVSSHPEQGETEYHSDEWVRIQQGKYFATVVYLANPDQVVSQLPECPPTS
jgi:hypothetical protein